MSGPWEDYASQPAQGPWNDYKAKTPAAAAPSPSFADTAIDVAKSGARGLGEGVASTIGLPGFLSDLANQGMDRLTGANVAQRNPSVVTPESVNRVISAPTGGYHQPQTTAGKYAETIASFAPSMLGGEASIPARALRAVLPGVGAETAGQATAGTPYEPYARIAGGLFGASLPAVGQGLAKVAGKVAPSVLGMTTGVGSRAVKEAYRAGSAGGPASDAFTGAMRTETPSDAPVGMMQNAVSAMRADRGAAYRSDMGALSQDNHILDFTPIDNAISKLDSVKNFKGVDLSPSTAGVRGQIKDAVSTWKTLPPQDFHTPEGFDALKQQIGDIRDSTPFGSPDRVVANGAYNAVKDSIVKQSPGYAKTMGDYSNASDKLNELQSELSLKPNTNPNTTLRKLQSIMRDNVNTSWGKRQELGDALGARQPDLMPTLAGQALSSPIPRGLAKWGDAAALGGAGALIHNPGLLLSMPFMSPRIVGEAAYGLGATARALRPAVAPLTKGYKAGLFGSIPLSLSPMMAH